MDNNGQYQEDGNMVLQHKKDQFRVEIRKKRMDNLIQQKRIKLFSNINGSNQSNPNATSVADAASSSIPSSSSSKNLTSVDVFKELEANLRRSINNSSSSSSTTNVLNSGSTSGIPYTNSHNARTERMMEMTKRRTASGLGSAQLSTNSKETNELITQIAHLICDDPSPIDQAFETGIPGLALDLLEYGVKANKIMAGSILANLAAGTKEQVQRLYTMDLIPILIRSISLRDWEIGDHTIFALNNALISNMTPANLQRIYELNPNIVDYLCSYFQIKQVASLQFMSTIILCLFFVTKINQVTHLYYDHSRVCLPYLAYILDTHHPNGPAGSLWQRDRQGNQIIGQNREQQAMQWMEQGQQQNQTQEEIHENQPAVLPIKDLFYCVLIVSDLSQGDSRVVSDCIKAHVDDVMIRYLEQGLQLPDQFLQHVVRILANISSGNDYQSDQLLKKNILAYLKPLLNHELTGIRKEVCWLISNLAAGNPSQIDIVLGPKGIFHALVQQLRTEMNLEVRKELLLAVSNPAEQGTNAQIALMVNEGIIEILAQNIECDLSVQTIIPLLESLESILKKGIVEDHNGVHNLYQRRFEQSGCQQKVHTIFYEHQHETVVAIAGRILKIHMQSTTLN